MSAVLRQQQICFCQQLESVVMNPTYACLHRLESFNICSSLEPTNDGSRSYRLRTFSTTAVRRSWSSLKMRFLFGDFIASVAISTSLAISMYTAMQVAISKRHRPSSNAIHLGQLSGGRNNARLTNNHLPASTNTTNDIKQFVGRWWSSSPVLFCNGLADFFENGQSRQSLEATAI